VKLTVALCNTITPPSKENYGGCFSNKPIKSVALLGDIHSQTKSFELLTPCFGALYFCCVFEANMYVKSLAPTFLFLYVVYLFG